MNADLYKSLIKDEIISLSLLLLKEIKLFQFQVMHSYQISVFIAQFICTFIHFSHNLHSQSFTL